jgi:hypothetical protein
MHLPCGLASVVRERTSLGGRGIGGFSYDRLSFGEDSLLPSLGRGRGLLALPSLGAWRIHVGWKAGLEGEGEVSGGACEMADRQGARGSRGGVV